MVTCPSCGRRNRVPAAGPGVPRCGQCKTALPWITDACDADFAEIANASALPVLVDLWAPWCVPCHMVSPALEHLAQELAGRVKLVKVNVDEATNLANRFAAKSIPMLLVLDRGRVVARHVGAAPETTLRRWLTDALTERAAT